MNKKIFGTWDLLDSFQAGMYISELTDKIKTLKVYIEDLQKAKKDCYNLVDLNVVNPIINKLEEAIALMRKEKKSTRDWSQKNIKEQEKLVRLLTQKIEDYEKGK